VVRNPDPNRSRLLGASKKAPELAAVTAMSSMQNSKSSTKTRRSNENDLSATVRKRTVAGATQQEREKEKYGSS
jgi:hypothetical protein